jgi:hypothetical protein
MDLRSKRALHQPEPDHEEKAQHDVSHDSRLEVATNSELRKFIQRLPPDLAREQHGHEDGTRQKKINPSQNLMTFDLLIFCSATHASLRDDETPQCYGRCG